VFFALRYAICKRKEAAASLLPFCVQTVTTQQAGIAAKPSSFVDYILSSNLGRVINYNDLRLCEFT
jgi:hypothetical protein